jgi:heme o synthase
MINYLLITKPGILMGNLVTLAAGFLLGSKGGFEFALFCETFLGLAFIMASACIFNNYIDRQLDKNMERTKNRPLVQGVISVRNALVLATLLGIIGALVLLVFTNLLTVFIAAFGFFVYVILYSLWKSHTVYATAIGSIAGATPPVVGYCAASDQFDIGAVILFAMMVLWQMPHFFAIVMYNFDDYVKAKIPVLPVSKGMLRTKIHMVLYIIAFALATAMLTFFNYTGYAFLIVAVTVSLMWLWLCLKGFSSPNNQLWGCHMFRLSLVVIAAISIAIPFDAQP